MIQVLHHNRCGKSRACLAFLEKNNIAYDIIPYLEKPLTEDEIVDLLEKLNKKPLEIIRQKESIWVEKFKGKKLTDKAIIKAIVAHPILMERPIVIRDKNAVIARDINVLSSFI